MVSLSNIPFLFVTLGVGQWTIRGLMLLRGVSMAFSFVPLQAATYANINKPDTGRASAIFTTQRQASAAVGVALLSTIFISRRNFLVGAGHPPTDPSLLLAYHQGVLGAFHYAFAGSIVLSIIGALYAWIFIKDIDAEPTMRPRPRKQRVNA